MARIGQFLLLTWKNFKLQFRHPWVTILELGVPAFFSLILVLIRSAISSEYVSKPVVFDPFGINSLPANLTPTYNRNWQILYAPPTDLTRFVMKQVATNLKITEIGFLDEENMLDYFSNHSSVILSGVVFESELENSTFSNQSISYRIRPKAAEGGNSAVKNTISNWYTDLTFPLFPALGPRNSYSGYGGSPGYMSEGFLPVQHSIAVNVIQYLLSDLKEEIVKNLHTTVDMNRYPYPPYLDDKFIVALQLFFPMIICFSFIYPAVNIVKNLVIEKEKRIKEAMKMMGLSRWLHWMAWYFKYFIFLCISCGIMTLLLCVKFDQNIGVINTSDPSVIFFWLILYVTNIISFCFLISTMFSKANSAAAGAGVIFFLSFVPYFFILPRYNNLSHTEKMVSCLLPNIAIALGSVVLTVSEASGSGLQWSNLKIPASPDDTLTMSSVFVMYVVSGIVCLIITWYVEAVFPGEYGVPEPWYFPFTRSYWCGPFTNYSDMIQFYDSNVKKPEFFERDPVELMAGIQIQGLTKVFKKGTKPAVNNMNLNMYRSHITVLLGHNGAGKTTTISMLTGLITPTSGTATVNGYDICDDMSSVHSSLGICPQHDVLFDELTVKEHLYFFCKLKGYISDLVPSEIERIMTCLGLVEKKDAPSSTLSGGWKRKLSVGIALVGGSRVVILDEPTSGMDPYNRRSLWDVLQAEKEDRTILLTTHFMEEADVLGDRIAIMANGEVQCCGSPLFLKKKYGAGYHLVMVKEPLCDVSIITHVIQSYVPSAEMASNIGSELKYILPHESSSYFYGLFSELEKRKGDLKVSSYGASITTMEEVFIKVGRDATLHDSIEVDVQKESFSPTDSGIHVNSEYNDNFSGTDVDLESVESEPERRNIGLPLFGQQLYALLEKRVLHSYRNSLLTISQLILSPFFLILTLLMLKTLPKPQDAPALVLDVKSYHGTEIPYIVDLNSNVSVTLGNIFSSQFNEEDKPVLLFKSNSSMTSYLLNEARSDLSKYNMHNMIAATFFHKNETNETKITAYFNNQAYHSPAISLLTVDNALLKYFVNDSYSFAVTNHPLPRTLAEKGKQQQTQTTESYQIAQDIMFGMAFLVASFSIFIIKERSSNCKHLQRVSGVNLFSYWIAAFLWDFLNYLIPCCLVLLVFFIFKTEGLNTPLQLGRLFLLFFIHGFAALPFIYCCTFLFLSPSTAYVRLSLFNILIGIACLLSVTILEIPDLGVEYVAKPVDNVFSLLIPNYSLGRAVSNLYQNYQFNKFCNSPEIRFVCAFGTGPLFDLVKPCCKDKCNNSCIPWEEDFLSIKSPGIGKQLLFFTIQAVTFTVLLVLCEKNFLRYLKYKLKNHKVSPVHSSSIEISAIASPPVITDDIEDDDVRAERLRILNTPMHELFVTNHLVVKDLTKFYGPLPAVNKVTFGVQKGECFGLLGLNGAGKTTTFKMITGDESISSGEVFLNGFSIKKSTRKVQNRIGYCPQFDALIDHLTGSETLTMFARLRGIPEFQIPNQISALGELLGFEAHMNKQVKEYSGGNKRKLSTAIALIGKPPVVFLDEPTTGMDPVSRRYMWKALLQVIQSGCSIVLTSHSMEECEALCSRLVIMVNGKLCCLGSSQHLKNKFAQGFTLLIKVNRRPTEQVFQMRHPAQSSGDTSLVASWLPSSSPLANDVDDVKAFVERTFISASLKSATENILHYHIPNPQLNWSEIFKAMEEAKLTLNIEDYSVGETTLEQVFLNFAMVQRDAEVLT